MGPLTRLVESVTVKYLLNNRMPKNMLIILLRI